MPTRDYTDPASPHLTLVPHSAGVNSEHEPGQSAPRDAEHGALARATFELRSPLALATVMVATVLFLGHSLPGLAAPVGADRAAQATPEPGKCGLDLHKYAAPDQVQLGETVQVTLVLTATCNANPAPLHIVLVVDASNTDASIGDEMKDKLVELVRHLDLDGRPWIMVGVVEYSDEARTRCQLTNQEGRVRGCIGAISFDGGTRSDLGIQEGLLVLRRGRPDPAMPQPREVMLVTLTGTPSNGCGPATQAAADAKGEGVLVMSVAAGATADARCAAEWATSPRYAFALRDWAAVLDAFDRIIEQSALPHPVAATITDTLPVDMEYVVGSAVPAAVLNGRDLLWQVALPPDTITVTFGLRPLEPGLRPTNVEARAQVSFAGHPDVTGVFPVPQVEVIPGVSPTVSPTATVQQETPEPTSTHTPAGRSWRIYLPDNRTRQD